MWRDEKVAKLWPNARWPRSWRDHVVVVGDVAERTLDHRARNAGGRRLLLEALQPAVEAVRAASAIGRTGGVDTRRQCRGQRRRDPPAPLHRPLLSHPRPFPVQIGAIRRRIWRPPGACAARPPAPLRRPAPQCTVMAMMTTASALIAGVMPCAHASGQHRRQRLVGENGEGRRVVVLERRQERDHRGREDRRAQVGQQDVRRTPACGWRRDRAPPPPACGRSAAAATGRSACNRRR